MARKGRLLDERAVAEPRNCLNPIWAADDLHATRIYSAKRASKQSTSYILKKPVAPPIWTALVEPSPGRQSWVRYERTTSPAGTAGSTSRSNPERPSAVHAGLNRLHDLPRTSVLGCPVPNSFSGLKVLWLLRLLGLCSGKDVLERLVLLLIQFRNRQRHSGQHLIAHGGVVDEYRFDHSRLLQVGRG